MVNRLFFMVSVLAISTICAAQNALFTFDDVPYHTPLPINVSSNGITAHMTGGLYNYSVQQWGTLGIAPTGMSGNYIWPNSVYLSDLSAEFDTWLNRFSILYAPQELNTDSSCQMKVTVYLGATLVGTAYYRITTEPYFWPTGQLQITTTLPFNRAVVHYNAPPPTGGDYGVIFVADNMEVTGYSGAIPVSGIITLQDSVSSSHNATLEFRPVGGGAATSFVVPVTQNGTFGLNTTLRGNFGVSCKASHWLRQTLTSTIVLAARPYSGLSFSLINGDVDGDNEIGPGDFGQLSSAFGSVSGDANWNQEADLDGDGEVGPSDFGILSSNFGLSGDA